MAEAACGGSVQACALRVSVLESDGVPLPGPLNTYTVNTVAKLDATPVYVKGVDMEQVNACGQPSLLYKDMDRFKRFDLQLDMIHFDVEFENMLLATEMFTAGGLNIGTGTALTAAYGGYFPGVSLEIWSKHIVNGDIDITYPYIQWVFPRTRWVIDKVTWDNNPMARTFMGYTSANPNYYNGPLNDWPFVSDSQLMSRMTTVLPTPTCGATTLVHS